MAEDHVAHEDGPPLLLDQEGRLRLLPPDTYDRCRLVAHSCTTFQSKLHHFQNLVKQLLDQVSEKAQQIETAKLSAVGMRNLVSAEIETRSENLRDQRSLIAYKEEQLEMIHSQKSMLGKEGSIEKIMEVIFLKQGSLSSSDQLSSIEKSFVPRSVFCDIRTSNEKSLSLFICVLRQRLNAEYESLLVVKQEQEITIARLSNSSLQV